MKLRIRITGTGMRSGDLGSIAVGYMIELRNRIAAFDAYWHANLKVTKRSDTYQARLLARLLPLQVSREDRVVCAASTRTVGMYSVLCITSHYGVAVDLVLLW